MEEVREGCLRILTQSDATVSQFVVEQFPQPGWHTGEIPREVGEFPRPMAGEDPAVVHTFQSRLELLFLGMREWEWENGNGRMGMREWE